ncbi:MAG: large-conductance mechanosensitive channel protein [Chloroflexi bacterium]|jgi:large conductance mechanosensitive channel|nr:large-conductance mechanosensitive channel protein [Chloroflexota bacterium]
MIEEFKKFIMRGNVLDLAVGIVIGAAFGSIVNSFVNDILMPPIGLLLGGVDFSSLMLVLKEGTVPPPYETVAMAQEAGAVTINYGVFINTLITFLIVALAVFMLVKVINRYYVPEPEAPAPAKLEAKECPFCAQEISIKASRCPYCTSQV